MSSAFTFGITNSVTRVFRDSCHAVFFLGLATVITFSTQFATAQSRGKTKQTTLHIRRSGTPSNARFEVVGLNGRQIKSLQALEWDRESWNKVFAVYVQRQSTVPLPPIYGDYSLATDGLVFQPGFPLKAGLTYRAEFLPVHLPRVFSGESRKQQLFSWPRSSAGPTATVTAVYPSGQVLPENLLKFYLHFSQPMSRGEAYQRIHLLDPSGKPVSFPFLELAEELWDPQGTRFTLLFDPGRIKRGLKPREEVGPALIEGGSYTLVIDKDWQDASGQPLKAAFQKKFRVAPPDDRQPDPQRWEMTAPAAATQQALLVLFDEPLDHAMLQRVLGVVDPAGKSVPGRVQVDKQERRWSFYPAPAWQVGTYQLLVKSELEDRSGNSIGRPFEVDLFRQVDKKIPNSTVRIPFNIAR